MQTGFSPQSLRYGHQIFPAYYDAACFYATRGRVVVFARFAELAFIAFFSFMFIFFICYTSVKIENILPSLIMI
jgi:hypothetical protein